MAVDPALTSLVSQAVRDLARRTSSDPASIAVTFAQSVVWPDASLGCPKPGMRYRQVPEDGALIHLQAAGLVYRYHVGGSRTQPFLCEQEPARTTGTPDPRLTPRFDSTD